MSDLCVHVYSHSFTHHQSATCTSSFGRDLALLTFRTTSTPMNTPTLAFGLTMAKPVQVGVRHRAPMYSGTGSATASLGSLASVRLRDMRTKTEARTKVKTDAVQPSKGTVSPCNATWLIA